MTVVCAHRTDPPVARSRALRPKTFQSTQLLFLSFRCNPYLGYLPLSDSHHERSPSPLPSPLSPRYRLRRCVEVMNAYAKERRAFGKPINTYGQVSPRAATLNLSLVLHSYMRRLQAELWKVHK